MPFQVIVRNGTCIRKLENGTVFRIQRYICQDCRYSFVARPPNYGYGKHYPSHVKEKSIVNAGTIQTLFHMRKWIRIKPKIWITLNPTKMHKNQPAITSICTRVKTSLRKITYIFHTIGRIIILPESVKNTFPSFI